MGNLVKVCELDDIKNDQAKRYVVAAFCCGCDKELTRTKICSGKEIHEGMGRIALASPLATKPCPAGCRSSGGDWNANTTLRVLRLPDTPAEDSGNKGD